MHPLLQKHADKFRFGIVGCINTVLDFGILFLLSHLGVPVIVANFISTTIAFGFSFTANKKFTFKSTGGNTKKQLILFILVTFFGLWVLQPIIISFIKLILGHIYSVDLVLLLAKLTATVITLVWNYVWYSRVVFSKREDREV